ncbi:aldolase/citrate lyase family protein [Ilyobacter polytropus]|uniref:HpcH/HpaI aldolase/citrate lyase domain-containing protein n=1 Tax=Ilyobacter polytropus (strain ATCC 51220 / DSM 2926 / LMG 16218 / CuHBu1) TaxID=572544 RepID=E3HBV2_ILYPC|nr:aldolase/citrate lyase family protein [Ilyobacter polytropus]ADO83864.1 conserved hypothetical protein [Ilyobacter polytropus DSM 2926]
MREIENSMVETLIKLREEFGASCLKMSFETENLGMFELLKVKDIANRAGVDLLMKLGGCEALADIEVAKNIGSSIVLGPMIESRFALEKYLQMCEKVFKGYDDVKFLINIETIESCKNIEDILAASNVDKLEGIVVGRTDLCRSLNNGGKVNSEEVLSIVKELFEKTKKYGVRCMLGGGISPESMDFFDGLGNLLDGFETRKVVFKDAEKPKKDLKKCLDLALEAELNWYELKKNYYSQRFTEDDKKIQEMKLALRK